MRKKFLQLFLALMVMFNSSAIGFANEFSDHGTEFFPEVTNYSSLDSEERPANGIPIKVTSNSDGTGCKVYVGNVGVDGLDSVTVTVKATGYSSPKSQTSYVIPVAGKTFSFSFPMIKSSTTYNATVKITDGGKTITKTGTAKIEYTESKLSGVWHKGTFATRGASLDYHFNKHKSEVSSTNIVSYINKARGYRSEVLNSLTNITTTTGTGSIPSTKYKHKIDGRFIILTNSGKEILSFGK